ncbi:YajD family HNH nuclease [Undibacterium parvum]|uniref:Putative HNH nuclease YajD n=1 Tax=Undibacterium parvum TaxID=401471 RepID=A0A3Q9BQN9_9BURK|nr:YajD family HNH nuclease [Undibacterium parvum]AZP11788.1 HNH nuclease family protein [Undibacterium parvum]
MISKKPDNNRLDQIVAEANRNAAQRATGYRERSLKMYPWICGRCMREFTHANLSQLTVHHRDHNHDNNPPDGSNWELLCLYCHDNEHSRYLEADQQGNSDSGSNSTKHATHNPFAALQGLLKKKEG